jgi:DNA repair protein RadC
MDCKDVYIREVRVSYLPTEEKLFDVREPSDVARFVRQVLTDNSREHLIALYLNGSNSVAGFSIISIGSANSATVHPREVFQRAITSGATALVLCHNHPSGQLIASVEDERATRCMKDAGKLLGIPLLDHIIVTDAGYYSMKESGPW